MVCTTWKKLSFAALAVTLLAACGGPEREPVGDSQDSVVAGDDDERLSASAVCTFNIYAQSLYVQRDQRTGTYNYEGELELRGDFLVNNAYQVSHPSAGYSKVGQGGVVEMKTLIAPVSINGVGTAGLYVDLREEEYGVGGGSDAGSAAGSISLDCSQFVIEKTFPVTISENSPMENTALVQVTFRAVRTGWTAWLNRDLPSGNGDYELLADFIPLQTCPNPVAIECRTTSGIDWTLTGEVYTCNPSVGGYCRNADQPDGFCLDYQVRFLCQ